MQRELLSCFFTSLKWVEEGEHKHTVRAVDMNRANCYT